MRTAASACRTSVRGTSGDVPLHEHVHPISLGVDLQPPLVGAWTQLTFGERIAQPIRADGKVPILPRLVEVLDL